MNIENQNGYMLLYRSDEWYNKLSHQVLHSLMDQNKAWIEKLTAQGKAKPGRALERRGAIVSGKNGRFITDGPFAESKEAIGGYLVLDVETLEEAVAIAQTIPGLAYGGRSKCGHWLKNVLSTSAHANWRGKNNLQRFKPNNT